MDSSHRGPSGSRHIGFECHSRHGLGRRPIGLSVMVTLERSSLTH